MCQLYGMQMYKYVSVVWDADVHVAETVITIIFPLLAST